MRAEVTSSVVRSLRATNLSIVDVQTFKGCSMKMDACHRLQPPAKGILISALRLSPEKGTCGAMPQPSDG